MPARDEKELDLEDSDTELDSIVDDTLEGMDLKQTYQTYTLFPSLLASVLDLPSPKRLLLVCVELSPKKVIVVQ